MEFVFGKYFGNGAIGYSLLVFLGSYVLLEACIEDIPHLRFAEFVVLTLFHLIIGVHLNGDVLMGIDDFGEEWQLVVVTGCYLSVKDLLWSSGNDIGEVVA